MMSAYAHSLPLSVLVWASYLTPPANSPLSHILLAKHPLNYTTRVSIHLQSPPHSHTSQGTRQLEPRWTPAGQATEDSTLAFTNAVDRARLRAAGFPVDLLIQHCGVERPGESPLCVVRWNVCLVLYGFDCLRVLMMSDEVVEVEEKCDPAGSLLYI